MGELQTYSGFVFKKQETSYQKSVYALLFLISSSFVSAIKNASNNLTEEQLESLYDKAGFLMHFKKLFGRMNYLETLKGQPPKFTRAVQKLVQHINIRQDYIDKEAIESLRKSLTRSEEAPGEAEEKYRNNSLGSMPELGILADRQS